MQLDRSPFVAWVAALVKVSAGVIAIGGKTSRRSGSKKNSKKPIHMVSAFAARQRLVMGQIAVAEKSNEIVAIPALLDMMAIEGAIVTIDAMGSQRHRQEDQRREGRLHHRAQGQSGNCTRTSRCSPPSRKP
ncbi:ISAs1 family transposase [Bradyrhizobium sp. CCGUVB1N3]|uniref:ISAs1 family transposase n=1 Tax=Bradyrhizobium sp. CCGUVB1N3 TaxID=2949629 RepID=UPI0035327607